MKKMLFLSAILTINTALFAQEIIELPFNKNSNVVWEGQAKSYYSDIWQTDVVTNVSVPTMEVFKPEKPNGMSVIIAPGGGLYALSIKNEGTAVAKWLNEKGITAFVLKYRLVPTREDGVKEITDESTTNPQKIAERITPVLPLSIADGLSAIAYVRTNTTKWNIDPQKIGFMGFSAGGAVTMGVVYNYNSTNRPNFIVPVYPWTTAMPVQEAPADAPPMLVICATDDPLGLAAGSVELYSSWLKAEKNAGLHMYSKGGHGFGMKQQGLPSDNWIERFYNWSEIEITNKDLSPVKM
ncbi:alpha/beta hydrolase [Maribacter sp. CXY002]|uniref:alpha/beta hydrolase n=1 Tax=Maribacter luteocoastalis TaxID=3407671 RepID=UPI003B67DC85